MRQKFYISINISGYLLFIDLNLFVSLFFQNNI